MTIALLALQAACGGGGSTPHDTTAPTVVSATPLDGATGVPRSTAVTVRFSEEIDLATVTATTVIWTDAAGAPVAYAPTFDPATNTLTLTPSGALANYRGHAVQVTTGVTDLAGNHLGTLFAFDFTTADDVAPSMPGDPTAPVAFVGLTAFTAAPVAFSWDPAIDDGSGVASYTLQVATATDGTGLRFDASVGDTLSHDFAGTDGDTLYARVHAVDASGNPGPWSNWSVAYLVDASPPAIANPPADRGGFDTMEVDFSWDPGDDGAGSGVVTWVLEISTAQDPSGQVLLDDRLDPHAIFLAEGFPDGTTFYARARPVDRVGNLGDFTAWSDGVTLDTTGPSAATTPTDRGDWDDASVTFGGWSASDAGSGVASYYLEVQTLPGNGGLLFGANVGAVTSYAFDASGLTSGDRIFAAVRAVDALGNVGDYSPWSDGIRVDLVAPTVASAPDDGGANAYYLEPVHFDWPDAVEADSGLAGYTIEIDTGTSVVTDTALTSSFDYLWTGARPVTLTARVRATDVAGNVGAFTGWSDGIEVRDDVPGAPGIPRDGGAYTSSTSITFDWDAPSAGSPDHYVLEVRTAEGLPVFEQPVFGVVETVSVAGWPDGTRFFARVAAVNGLGVQGAFSGWSDGIVLDTSAPSAPGTPIDRGEVDDRYVTFAWTAAQDLESGVVRYEVEVFGNGTPVGTFETAEPTYVFDAEWGHLWVITARVRAVNGAGLWSAWTDLSDGVTVDTMPPQVISTRPGSEGNVPTNVDLHLRFSEPMDQVSVAQAFSLAWSGGSPQHGYVFVWSADSTEATVIPDTAHPEGATNVDLLPAETPIAAALAAGATDLAGNALASPFSWTFTTADETPPVLVSLTVNGRPSPFDPADVQGNFTAMATFDEDMSTERARVRLDVSGGSAEGGYQTTSISGAVASGGSVTYTTWWCGTEIQPGDRVTVRGTSPPSFDVTAAAVTAVGPCSFTVANPTTDTYTGGGSVSYPTGATVRPNWVDLRTLEIRFASWVRLPAGSEARLGLSDLSDADGNWTWSEQAFQVGNDPGADGTPPSLVASLPRDGDRAAPAMRPVVLKFSEPLDRASVAGVTAFPDLYEIRYDTDAFGASVVLMPRRSPAPGEVVTVSVPATVRDLAGNALAAPVSVSFTVGSTIDAGAPTLVESIPPDGQPADEIWQAEAGFADGLSGELDPLDADSVGMEDLAVTNLQTGLLVRGWRAEVDPATAFVRLVPPPRGPGLSRGWTGVAVTGAVAAGGFATYDTAAPHGLAPGARVRVSMYQPADWGFNAYDAPVVSVTETTFTLATPSLPDSTSANGGSADYAVPASYLVEIAVGANRGGTGVFDAFGNAMPQAGFTAYVVPWGNRVPIASSLRDLRAVASSSPAGRTLRADGGVRDPDRQVVHVTVASGGTVLLEQDVDTSNQWGFQAGGDGPPQVTDPAAMATLVPGPLDLTITLDDTFAQTVYARRIWLWDESESPSLLGIQDGSTLRAVDALRPVVVESTPSPAFQWGNVDLTAADLVGAYVVETAAVGSDGPPSGAYFETVPLPPEATLLAAPRPLHPDLYLWTVVQMKMARGTNEFVAQSWALDFNEPFRSMFVYGPSNRQLGGDLFAGARLRVSANLPAAPAAVHDATGFYAFESPGGGEAPLTVGLTLTDNEGTSLLGQEMFAAEASTGAFMLTASSAGGMPAAGKGGRGTSGELFAVAHPAPDAPMITAGAYRYQNAGFGTALGGSWVYAQIEAETGAVGLGGVGGSVGSATPSATTLSVAGRQIDDTPLGPMDVPYTLTDDGLFEINIGDPADDPWTQIATGWVGGGPAGRNAAVLASRSTPGRVFWLLTAEEADWTGFTGASLVGAFRIADMSFGRDPATGDAGGLGGASGDAYFWGDGTFSYVVGTPGGAMSGGGTYTVDTVARRIALDVVTPEGTNHFVLVAGPGFETLFGVSVAARAPTDPERAEILILTR
ncbi:MAG TPA: Ig-like domain-containing protein [Anaeromyxobacteraceae bacterium]|nr:Ig-like domain-containing protein [Anaeromyxobacteraceae bacterium]